MAVAVVLSLAPAAALSGCRDATSPPEPATRPVADTLPRRVTFSADDDRGPAWSATEDSLYYTTPGIPPFPDVPGLLLSVPQGGGVAAPLLPSIQLRGARRAELAPLDSRWLTNPALSPDGQRVAYVELESVHSTDLCLPPPTVTECSPEGADPTAPRLELMSVRVRPRGSVRPPEDEPAVRVRLEGRRLLPRAQWIGMPGVGTFEVLYHPFQQLFIRERSLVFRPSWGPEGSQIVFSDGLRLLVWDLETDDLTAVPGTEHGVEPAWSPDGRWIAFARLEHGDTVRASCSHYLITGGPRRLNCNQVRTVLPLTGRRITLVRPDGSEVRELAEGDEPAWLPDSERLVYRNAGYLWIGSLEGDAEPRRVPGSFDAREPAVSASGRLLAFAQLGPNGSFDLWVTEVPEE